MSFLQERNALISALFDDVDFLPTQWPNNLLLDTNFQPYEPSNEPFRRVTITRNQPTAATLGTAGKDEYTGLLIVDIMVPKGTGDMAALTHADEVATKMKWRKLAIGAFCLDTKEAGVTPMPDDSTWYGVSVSINFHVYVKRHSAA